VTDLTAASLVIRLRMLYRVL